jgi:hypothetical protein
VEPMGLSRLELLNLKLPPKKKTKKIKIDPILVFGNIL